MGRYKIVSLAEDSDLALTDIPIETPSGRGTPDLLVALIAAEKLDRLSDALHAKLTGAGYAQMAIEEDGSTQSKERQLIALITEASEDLLALQDAMSSFLEEQGCPVEAFTLAMPNADKAPVLVPAPEARALEEQLLRAPSKPLTKTHIASAVSAIPQFLPDMVTASIILPAAVIGAKIAGNEPPVTSLKDAKNTLVKAFTGKMGNDQAAKQLRKATVTGFNISMVLLNLWASGASIFLEAGEDCAAQATGYCDSLPEEMDLEQYRQCLHSYADRHPGCLSPDRLTKLSLALLITMPVLIGLGLTYTAYSLSKSKHPKSVQDLLNNLFGEDSKLAQSFATWMDKPNPKWKQWVSWATDKGAALWALPSKAAEKIEFALKLLPEDEEATLFSQQFIADNPAQADEMNEANILFQRLSRQATPSESTLLNWGSTATHTVFDFVPLRLDPLSRYRGQIERLIELVTDLKTDYILKVMHVLQALMVYGDPYLTKQVADTLSALIVKNMAEIGQHDGAKAAFEAFLKGSDPTDFDPEGLTQHEMQQLTIAVWAFHILKMAELAIQTSEALEDPDETISLPKIKMISISTAIQIVNHEHSILGAIGQFVFNVRTLGGILNFFVTDYVTAAVQERDPNFPTWALNLLVFALSREEA